MEEPEDRSLHRFQDESESHPTSHDLEKSPKKGWPHAIKGELRAHPVGYAVLGIFMLGGPIVISMVFPEAPLKVLIGGGVIFGAFAALMAVPDQFF